MEEQFEPLADVPTDGAADDTTASPAAASAPIDPVVAAQAKADEYLAGWQRAIADYANLKRESEKGATEIGKYASAGVVSALLPILDSFAKAQAARPALGDEAKLAQWADGIGHIKSQLDGAMAKLGVLLIDETNVPFNPVRHEAMMMQPAAEGMASGTVAKVLEPGYAMHDRVLRPAKVVVTE